MEKKPDYQSIVKHYENCLAKYGDSHKGVDWPDKAGADLRYKVMSSVLKSSEEKAISILDFGCGTAQFYQFLVDSGLVNFKYTGLDISPKFIDVARSKFPTLDFICRDFLRDSNEFESYDYIIMNGVFTEKLDLSFDEMWVYLKELLPLVFRHTKKAIAFNVMSKNVDWERNDLFHLPMDILAQFLTTELSRHFIFRHDYGLYEYTAYVFVEPNN
ncbi:class I SAM-dependent methyltransferase [Flavihumibacter sp. ZG627]|uniref:class I SAM-dependent methyltransferase n=1 Tax=Flavihumibacter sp. ZG627 TaxID=1463156 RepID=UPI00057DBC44|nr:class I SAM-dependent methyltransferase [Flavihumibacter sp. ZG627]KIC92328.1 SAM-dependent methlyltransferase [Flavihumibacter sp. ZG627]